MYFLKILFALFFAFSGIYSYAQLPTVYAKGGDGKNMDWESIKKEYEENQLQYVYRLMM